MLAKFLELTNAPHPRGVVHVGAHIGQEIIEYRNYSLEILVWIEADPRVYQSLLKQMNQKWGIVGTKQWLLNALVSDNDTDTIDFYIAGNNGQSSSIFPFTQLGVSRYPDAAPTGEVLKIRTRMLNTLLDELKLDPSHVDYLVLDTQGAELRCLKGLGKYISNLKYITSEVSTAEIYDGGAKIDEIDKYLENNNFLRVSGKPFWEHGDGFYVLLGATSSNCANTKKSLFLEHNREMRKQIRDVFGLIDRLGGGRRLMDQNHDDLEMIDHKLSQIFRTYEEIIVHPQSRNICKEILRICFDYNMGASFTLFLQSQGWPAVNQAT